MRASTMICCAVFLFAIQPATADDTQVTPEDGATLYIHDLTIPPSAFWSPGFRALYAGKVKQMRATFGPRPDGFPARNAPKAEWDKFDALIDSAFDGPLEKARERYPVDIEDTTIAGVHAGIVTPKGGVAPENEHRVLVNLRGGGFVVNRGLSFGKLESIPVASLGRMKVITLDYRQAPFFQYPAASEDIEAVYRVLLKHYKPEAIGIYGCSAGGVLTAQSVTWFQAKGLPRPGAIAALCSSPASEPANSLKGDSAIWGLSGVISESGETAPIPAAAYWYMESADAHDPVAYPGLSDDGLAKYPPTLMLIGTREILFSSAVVAHARLLKLGVDSSLYIMEGGWHAAHVMAVDTPEAHDANAYIARWFDRHLAPAGEPMPAKPE